MINIPELKPRIKGLKISQTPEKVSITGNEYIPYQEGDTNGRFKASEINKLNIFEFSPVIKDGKITAREYLNILTAIRNHKLIYVPKEDGTGKSIATEIRVKAGDIHLELLDYTLEEDKSKIATIVAESVDITSDLDFIRTKHVTPTFTVAGNGKHLLADNGEYISIDDWFLKDINFEGSDASTAVYGLLASKIILGNTDTDAVSWQVSDESSTTPEDYTVNLKLKIDLATWDKDGLMPRKDKWRLDVKIPEVLHKLEAEDEKLHLKDAELQENINDNYNKFIDFKYLQSLKNDEFSNAIEDEVTRAKEAEEVLTKKLETEASERKAKDDEYQQNFDEIKDQWAAGDAEVKKYVDELKDQVGKANGLATLDKSGKVPTDQLPAYVDDVLEYTHKDHDGHEADPAATYFPEQGESGKIYVDTTSGITYRWSGTQYVEISSSLALGETDSTAYKGSDGKKNRDALKSLPNSFVTDFVDGSQEYTDLEVKFKYKQAKRKASTEGEVGSTDNNLQFNEPEEKEVTIAAATHDKAGVMTALQHNNLAHLHEELGSIDDLGNKVSTVPKRLMTHIDPAVQEADNVYMDYMTYVQNKDGADKETAGDTAAYVRGKYERQDHTRITINAATRDKAGVVKSTDYKKLDTIPDDLVSTLDSTFVNSSADNGTNDTISVDYTAFNLPGGGEYTKKQESVLKVLKMANKDTVDGGDEYTSSLTGWTLSGVADEGTDKPLKDPVLTFDTTNVPTKTKFEAEVKRAKDKEAQLADTIDFESSRAQEAERDLHQQIVDERLRAESKEYQLQSNIEAEQARAELREKELDQKIDDETKRAEDVESKWKAQIDKNTDLITEEKERASKAESELTRQIVTEEERAEAAEERLEAMITAETERAKDKEQDLQDQIDAEEQRAQEAEKALDTKIEAETERATGQENELNNLIEAEEERATTKENELEGKITAEQNRAESAEAELKKDITDETTRATDKEEELKNQIDTETSRAQSAESNLDDKIEQEVTDRTTIDTQLQKKNEEQDGRLTEIEKKDQTQDSQITELQSKDTEHDSKIKELTDRLTTVEGTPITLTTDGTGNVVESLTLSGKTLTAKKGNTYALKSEVTSVQNQLNTLVSGNASTAIDNFNEIEKFLTGVTETYWITKRTERCRNRRCCWQVCKENWGYDEWKPVVQSNVECSVFGSWHQIRRQYEYNNRFRYTWWTWSLC